MARLKGQSSINPGILALAICAGVLWTDLVLKHWAENTLTEPVLVTSWLCFALQYNAGLFLGTLPVASVAPAHWFVLGAAILGLGWRMARAQPGHRRRLCPHHRRGDRKRSGQSQRGGGGFSRLRARHRREVGLCEPRRLGDAWRHALVGRGADSRGADSDEGMEVAPTESRSETASMFPGGSQFIDLRR